MRLFNVLNPNFRLTGKPALFVTMTKSEIRQLSDFRECGDFALSIDRMFNQHGWRIYEFVVIPAAGCPVL